MLPLVALMLAAPAEPTKQEWTVGGATREALIVAPAKPTDHPPLVFVFHGHGGTMKHASQKYDIHTHWPEAVVIYPQGLNTPGRLTDPAGKKAGWQHTAGDHADRDLTFFDAMLATAKEKYHIDPKRVYSTGHSNGGGFTYLLWAARPGVFAAVAPSAAGGRNVKDLKPIPCLHVAGEKDELVKFEWQQATMAAVRKTLGCDATGTPAGKRCTEYPSKTGTPFVAYIHPGAHTFPPEAIGRIAEFFRRHAKP